MSLYRTQGNSADNHRVSIRGNYTEDNTVTELETSVKQILAD